MSTTACNLYRFILPCHCHCPYAIITALLHLINISVTGTHDLIGRDAECASGFSVAHAHASLNTSSPSYASRPKSAIPYARRSIAAICIISARHLGAATY